jgi:hypothetical protein
MATETTVAPCRRADNDRRNGMCYGLLEIGDGRSSFHQVDFSGYCNNVKVNLKILQNLVLFLILVIIFKFGHYSRLYISNSD